MTSPLSEGLDPPLIMLIFLTWSQNLSLEDVMGERSLMGGVHGRFLLWSFNCKSVILGGEGSQDILEQLSFLWLRVVCNVSYNAWET